MAEWTIQKTKHYEDIDTDCSSDYVGVDVVATRVDGETIRRSWGDDYHDKGEDKCDGWIEAFFDLFSPLEVTILPTVRIADTKL